MHEFLVNIAIIVIVATVFAYIARLLKQPIIPAYILAGVFLGPLGLGQIANTNTIFHVAEVGIAFLLFMVGLEMSYKRFKKVGKNAAATGIANMLLMSSAGYIISIIFGFFRIEALYLGLALAFGSTMVVLKLLSDKEELKSLHGRLMIGILLTEDIGVIIILMILKNLNNLSLSLMGASFLKVIGFLVFSVVAAKYVIPKIFGSVAKHQDFLFLGSIAWFFLAIVIANAINFSIAIGAFIAGISLASTPYNIEIVGKIKHLKDFFAAIFFVSLGMLLVPISSTLLWLVIGFLVIILLIKPLFIHWLLHFSYHRKSSFLTGTGLAQISEFSLIIATTGLMLNHISQQIFSIIVLIAVITMSITPYLTKYNGILYNKLATKYSSFKTDTHFGNLPKKLENHTVLCGAHRTGCEVIKALKELKREFVVIDYNPETIQELMDKNISCIYGDVEDLEILNKVKLDEAKVIISTIPLLRENLFLLKVAKLVNKDCIFLVTAKDTDEAAELYSHGADYVVVPHTAGGEILATILEEHIENSEKVKKLRKEHINNLRGKETVLDMKDPFLEYFHNGNKREDS